MFKKYNEKLYIKMVIQMKQKIFVGVAFLGSTLAIKFCRKVSKNYAEKHKGDENKSVLTKAIKAGVEFVNDIADIFDFAVKFKFASAFI